jgi:hypothetical protein
VMSSDGKLCQVMVSYAKLGRVMSNDVKWW